MAESDTEAGTVTEQLSKVETISELAGEGGWTHLVATAEFIILWDENGHSYVDSWWIEVLNDSEKLDIDGYDTIPVRYPK